MKTIIIGAGPAGIETAHCLAVCGQKVTVLEQSESPLDNIRNKALLFPDFSSAGELTGAFETKLRHPGIEFRSGVKITDMSQKDGKWTVTAANGETWESDEVVLATGYRPFDARRKEELGYGIYDGVITSLDMEVMLKRGRVVNSIGDLPRKVAFLQCVGSRDSKVGNNYCSKLCCITAAKQAIEVRKLLPEAEIYIFYMDLRMWGQGFEETYRSSQQDYGIHYVRGRICEAAGTFDGRVQIKAEDTLTGIPLKMSTDLLVLMVGMEASDGTRALSGKCGICGEYGFARSADRHLYDDNTDRSGLYVCGSCKRPMCIEDVVADARSTAMEILKGR